MLIVVAAGLTALVGAAAIATDVSLWYFEDSRVQSAADAAALAGVVEMSENGPGYAVAAAREVAARNGYSNDEKTTVVVNSPPNSGLLASDPTAVEVTITRQISPGLSRLFYTEEVTLDARAVAKSGSTGFLGCIIALEDRRIDKALQFNSIDRVELNCMPAANSPAQEAIYLNSINNFTASSLYTVGNYKANSIGRLTLYEAAQTGQTALADPYADRPDPSPLGCNYHNRKVSGTATISPGVYCGGFEASSMAKLTVKAGTYYIVDGDLKLDSIDRIICDCAFAGDGVTFVLTGSSPSKIGYFEINSVDTVSLQAPSDNAYPFPGMLIYVDRRANEATSKLNSINTATLNGALYAPSQHLQFNSVDSANLADCMQVIANTVEFNSIDGVWRADNCIEYGAEPIKIGGSSAQLYE